MSDNKRMAIIGCGAMGCDVAAIFLSHGWTVEATTRDPTTWSRRRDRVRQSLAQLGAAPLHVDRFHLRRDARDVGWSQIRFGLESVPEDFELKRAVFAELDTWAGRTSMPPR